MSGQAVDKEMAPKRQRMMDMVLVLGGLKEESSIPLSKVNEEVENLRKEITPLVETILAFPESYFKEFYETAERMKLAERIGDKVILSDAVSHLTDATSRMESKSITDLLEIFSDALTKLTESDEDDTSKSIVDIKTILEPLPEIVSQIESMINEFEEKSKSDAEAASAELTSLIDGFSELLPNIESDLDATLESLQKLGTKTRYGPFLRTTAQVRRGKREGRISEDRVLSIIEDNILTELRRGIIMFILNKMGSKTVVQLANLMKTHAKYVQNAIVSMIQRGEVEMVGLDVDAPVFARVMGKTPDTTLVLKRVVQQLRGISKSAEGTFKESVESSETELRSLLERLQLLSQYDETQVSVSMTQLREAVDSATEAVLSSESSDDSDELRLLVSAGLEAFTRFRLKITLEKGPNLVSGVNVYGEKLDPEDYERIMSSYLDSELERGTILILIRELGALTAKDLAEKTKISQDRIFRHLLRMKRDELLTTEGESHGYLLYDVPRTLNEDEITVQTISTIALQFASAREELESIIGDLKPESIGRLATSLETISKARDKLVTITLGGSIVAETILSSIEEQIRSAVVLAYRTRARIPSTRPKVTIDDLMDVDVPSVLDEYRSMMGYAPLLGFGTIEWDPSKCLGCKSCEISCPENAIEIKPVIDMPKMFDFSKDELEKLPVNKALFYETVRGLATTKPSKSLVVEEEVPGFGTVEVDLWLCVACRTCVRRCPGPETGALELDLKWNLPEVVKQITSET